MMRRMTVLLAALIALLPIGISPADAMASDLDAIASQSGSPVIDLTPISRVAQTGQRQPGNWVTFKDETGGGVRQVSDYLVDARPGADGSVGVTVRTTLMCAGANSAWFSTTKTIYADGSQVAYIGPDYSVAKPGSPISQQASFRVSGGGSHHVTSREDPFRPNTSVSAGWDFWVDVPYVISSSAGAGGSIDPSGPSFANAGSSRTYTVRPDAGHRVRDVVVDGSSVGAKGSYTFSNIRSNHTISAEFTSTHRVTFKDRGAILSEQTVDDGSSASAPETPTRKGYTFAGWDAEFSNVKSDIEVNATWRANSYKIRFDANGGVGEMPDQEMAYDRAAKLSPNGFSRIGYTWVGWTTGADGSGDSYEDGQEVSNLAVDDGAVVTLHARWRPNRYTVAFDKAAPAAKGSMPGQQMTYDAPEALSPCGFTWDGHVFMGWSSDGAEYGDRQVVENLSAADGATVTLRAMWDVVTHPVIFTDGIGNELSREEVPHGTSATEPEHPERPGYTFDGWDADFSDVTGPLTVTATWRPNRYAISFDANGGTGVMPDQAMTYDEADELDGCAFTRPGHRFRGWALEPGGAVAYNDRQEVRNLADEDGGEVELFAVWDEDADVRISYSAADPDHSSVSNSHEDVAPSSGEARGSTVTVADGYKLAGWFDTEGGDPVGGGASFKPERDEDGLWRAAVYEARIEPISYAVRFDANGGEGEMPDQQMTYDEIDELETCAFTRQGFRFTGWSSDGDADAEFDDGEAVSNLTIEDGAVVELSAIWAEDPSVTITYTAGDPAHSSVTVASELVAPVTGEAKGSEVVVGDGYELTGWTDWAGEVVGTEAAFEPEPASDGMWRSREYTARVAPVSYTIAYDANGGSGEMADRQVTYGELAALDPCAFDRPGHRFVGWATASDGSGSRYEDGQEVVNLTDEKGATVTLYAQWEKLELTVDFYDGQGHLIGTDSVPYGGKADAPAVPGRDGLEFTGWDRDFGCVTGDMDVTARWRKVGTGEAVDVVTGPGQDGGTGASPTQAAPDAKPLDQTGGGALILAAGALAASACLGAAAMRDGKE